MSADRISYLDSSALVKLVVTEPESMALRRYLRDRPLRASCALARVEVGRAIRRHSPAALTKYRQVLTGVTLVALDDPLLDAAAGLGSGVLRSLDAIHLAAAQTLGNELEAVITYDARMEGSARALGLVVASPR